MIKYHLISGYPFSFNSWWKLNSQSPKFSLINGTLLSLLNRIFKLYYSQLVLLVPCVTLHRGLESGAHYQSEFSTRSLFNQIIFVVTLSPSPVIREGYLFSPLNFSSYFRSFHLGFHGNRGNIICMKIGAKSLLKTKRRGERSARDFPKNQ